MEEDREGLTAKTNTATPDQARLNRSRRASRNSRAQLTSAEMSMTSRPTMTALGARSKPSVTPA
ncbi:hypothetical protein GCM10027610_077910 [Dactylosporangium cerinum]